MFGIENHCVDYKFLSPTVQQKCEKLQEKNLNIFIICSGWFLIPSNHFFPNHAYYKDKIDSKLIKKVKSETQ